MTEDGGSWSLFQDLIDERTTEAFVPRPWLVADIERALSDDGTRIVLITAEPGAGKTSLLADMARTHPQWLRYFVRKDVRSPLVGSDLQSFLFSIGHQLARLRPELFQPQRLEVAVAQRIATVAPGAAAVGIRIDDLRVSPFHRTAALRVEQEILQLSGSARGIEIGTATVEPRLLEPEMLAHLALIYPAQVLLDDVPDERIVIVLDALDEGAQWAGTALSDWLATGPDLPANVRVVVSSRLVPALDRLRSARERSLVEIPIDPRSREVRDDLLRYADRELATAGVTEALRANGRDAADFRQALVRRASGNFLYLAMYAQALRDAIAEHDAPLIGRLLDTGAVPPGLHGLYAFFVETARAGLERLGMLDVRDPVTPGDSVTPAWEGAAQPLLGILAVAREPMSPEQLSTLAGIRVWPRAVRSVLGRMRWLLTVRDDRYAFYHASIAQFLSDPRTRREHPDWGIADQEWHERIVRHYRAGAPSWAAVDWATVDRYGLANLADHLVQCRPVAAAEAHQLVTPGLLRAVRATFGSDRYFMHVVDTAAGQVLGAAPTPASTPTMLFLATVRRQLRRTTSTVVPAVYGLLARLGRLDDAIARLGALPPSAQQVTAALDVARHAPDPARRPALWELLVDVALVAPLDDHSTPDSLEEAARTLAPHDLRSALHLWQRSQRGRAKPAAPDDVYRAAATSANRREAIGHIGSMRSGRAGAYLDLAARDRAGEPAELLHLAERELDRATAAERLPCLVRLAGAWQSRRPDHAASLIARALAEAAAARGAIDDAATVNALAQAARFAAGPYPAVARQLLSRFDTATVTGTVDDAFLAAARTWAELGEVTAARVLLDRVIAFNRTVWTRIKVAAVLATYDRVAAAAMIEDAYATIPPVDSGQGFLSRIHRDDDLTTVAKAIADDDLDRAAACARKIASTTWTPQASDRYSALAFVAHRYADAGDIAAAQSILDEVLRAAATPPPVEDPEGLSFYHAATAQGSNPPPYAHGDRAVEMVAIVNHTNDWNLLVQNRLYLDPADVVRAMSPGTWSIGNPYSWARTVRAFAELIAERDLARATALVRALTDAGERAVGLAAMFRTAGAGPDRKPADLLWAEFREAYTAIPPYEWNLPRDEEGPLAYVRPDYRHRFDAAIRILPWETDPAMHLLNADATPYLVAMFQHAFAAHASRHYAAAVLSRREPFPPFAQVHKSLLGMRGQGPLFSGIMLGPAIVNEYLAKSAGAPPAVERIPTLEDELYASYAYLFVLGPAAFAVRARPMIGTPRLPAVAALAALAAETYGADHEPVAALCAEIIAATDRTAPAIRAVTLMQLARSDATSHLVDTEHLLEQTLSLTDAPYERVERDEALRGLFPTVLVKHTEPALRLLYEATTTRWSLAMALLESAAAVLVDALGPDVVVLLHQAVRRAVEYTSAGDIAPESIDGVRATL
jgi:hypothetical protein